VSDVAERPARAEPAQVVAWQGYAVMLLTTVLWAANNVIAKVSLELAPPAPLAAARFLLASLCLAVMLWLTDRGAYRRARTDWRLLSVLGLTGITLSNLTHFYGVTMTSVTDIALIGPATVPLWAALFARLMLGERLSRQRAAGMALSLVGVVLIVLAGASGEEGGGPRRVLGDLLLAASSGFWALYSVLGRRALQRYSALSLVTLGTLFGTAPMVALAVPAGVGWLVAAGPLLWIGLIYLSLVGTVLATLTWFQAADQLGVARAGQFTYLVPVWALLLAAAALGERPGWLQVGGALLVFGGLWFANRSRLARSS
jgi:drug/metabolite transporter (DMT)-like permease